MTVTPPANEPVDVCIVGAGPAGSAAAVAARRHGLSVLVVDKATFPRDKCCGDGLTTLALRQLELLGFDPATVPSWQDVDDAWLRSPKGREIRLPLPSDGKFAAVTPRLELDAALVDLARESGAIVLEDHRLVAITSDERSSRVTIEHDGTIRTITASWVVAADGMWSPTRKLLGLSTDQYLGEWHAFRQYASNVTGPAKDRLIVWFEDDLLPGYAWSFPLPGGRVNIGFGIWREGRRVQDMRDTWIDLLDRPHVRAALGPEVVLEGRHTAWPIPARIDQAVTGHHRVLFVGDAAMATDALTGEGIGQALLTGVAAAEAITAGGAAVEVRARYRSAVMDHLLADHRMSMRLSRVLARRRGAEGALAVVARSGRWGREKFARWMFEDEPRAVVVTPRRWHTRLLRRSGAYRAPLPRKRPLDVA